MYKDCVIKIFNDMIKNRLIDKNSSVLCVCATTVEKEAFQCLDFENVVISNLEEAKDAVLYHPYSYEKQNAMDLTYPNESFDFVFVSAGLHHCSSPHKALTAMYRVCKNGIVVFESRDSLLSRIAVYFKLTLEYETDAVVDGRKTGGVDNTEIPNYVYRWTEREFKKTINSYHPVGRNSFMFYYDLGIPERLKNRLIVCLLPIFTKIFKKQGNIFCMIALKPKTQDDLWVWNRLSSL